MTKYMIDIERGSNGGYVVTHYMTNPTSLQRMTGIKQEKEVLAFADAKTFIEWLQKI